jgi:acyl-CoA thioester hydrolase
MNDTDQLTQPFTVRQRVRVFEIDAQGHLTGAAYLQYANHALWECVRAAGVDVDEMVASGIGPVNLETTIRYIRELRGGDDVDVSCELVFGEGKTYHVHHAFRTPDGQLAAEVRCVLGMLDLHQRRLVADPAMRWRERASRPDVLGLA